jgi:hypothetical protein
MISSNRSSIPPLKRAALRHRLLRAFAPHIPRARVCGYRKRRSGRGRQRRVPGSRPECGSRMEARRRHRCARRVAGMRLPETEVGVTCGAAQATARLAVTGGRRGRPAMRLPETEVAVTCRAARESGLARIG